MPKQVAMFIGHVVRKNDLWKAARVRVYKMKLDRFLNMYFNVRHHYWAEDKDGSSKEGDIVLIKSLDNPNVDTPRVRYHIKEKVFPLGEVVDPITGRKCKGTQFLDEKTRKFQPLAAFPSTDTEQADS
ncbi:hypothetical protein LSH36_35g02096 [Paralvinella palmiformis]|uniref:Ribosomal protein S17 n=1 Tax=Paralvinella palmiformis TaxID=53620 RepID=A0AAD9NFV7_9ANNE|nr:hypothetical protein LSH36_35g02096 [Paralvinella palmiformis]